MIYTITLNTAIDEVLVVESQKKHGYNKIIDRKSSIGGKAIKTNILLAKYGIASQALGFVGGLQGTVYTNRLKELGILTNFVDSETYETRKATILVEKNTDGSSMFVEKTKKLDDKDIEQFFSKIDDLIENSIVVIAGSCPSGFTEEMFELLLIKLNLKNCFLICDVCDEYLKIAIANNANFVKPNEDEFKSIHQCETIDESVVLETLGKLKNYAVTLGGQGCIYKYNDKFETLKISPRFAANYEIKSTTGCGDMFIAGLTLGIINGKNPIINAMIHSMAKALEDGSDEINLANVEKMKEYIGG